MANRRIGMRYIEFSSASGGQPLVIVDDREPLASESALTSEGATQAATEPDATAGQQQTRIPTSHAQASLEDVVQGVRAIAESLIEGLQGLGPDEVSVQYGIKLHAEAGAVISTSRDDAHFLVELGWRAQPT
jgi:Trypsin-co-occurring domain 1